MAKDNEDIRWQQRYNNFKKAFDQLQRFLNAESLNEMEKQGLIKAFEYTYELAWKTLNDLLKDKGYEDVIGPKPTIQQGFQSGYISDGKAWMQMHKSRNLTSHTYEEATAEDIIENIRQEYFALFEHLKNHFDKEIGKQNKGYG
ncbi:MAG: nucleotidyltransferase substrate binding protein [Bacteroidales bacterium]|nr:nucleotidyltransferase substrate binding protein [Bacteroidales bacterium]MCF8338428.1 nucleotidyltransferase substrate binding protein [Bacteroidales bacterium]